MFDLHKRYVATVETSAGKRVPVSSMFTQDDEVPHWVSQDGEDFGRINQRNLFFRVKDIKEAGPC
jgi:hypothetical protein